MIGKFAEAMAEGRQVRFIYLTKADRRMIPRVGKVLRITPNHVLIEDAYHKAPRSCILDRIVGEVEIARG